MIGIVFKPLFDFYRSMDRMTINNEKNLSFALANQSFQKFLKHLGPKPLLEYHKVELPLIRNGRNHVAAKPLASPRDYRLLATAPIGTPDRMIRTQAYLVTSVDTCLFSFGLLSDFGIVFLKPAAYIFRVFLIGPTKRLLGCESPAAKVSPCRPNRQPNAKSSLYQSTTASRVHR